MDNRTLDSLFEEALRIPQGEDRAAFVSQSCSEDHALRADLTSLIRAHEESDDFLENAPTAVRLMAAREEQVLGGHIGSYRLERILGKGGMGTVFLATQHEPVQREVAIKILSTVEIGPEALSRFHVERHALCRLEHPNISRLFDAGALPDGTPYFVMDRLEGEPIDQHCDARDIPRDQRVRLLAEICDTLHYAHGRGVLHRDLKPSNVLAIGLQNETQIRVIDFGMAQLDGDGYPKGAGGGTPIYTSPEQAAGSTGDVTADIFSLGMIGCRLLSGWCPEDGRDAVSGKLELLPGDLGEIFAKATAEDPTNRYSSADAMARDLHYFLERKPVSAKKQTSFYLSKLFIRRNPLTVGLAVALTVALAAATLLSTKSEREIAAALERERGLRAESEMMAEYCRDLLRTPDGLSLQRSAQVKDLLATAAADASQRFSTRPALGADILSTLADSYVNLGYLVEARDLLGRVVRMQTAANGANSPLTVAALLDLGRIHLALGRAQEARTVAEIGLRRIEGLEKDAKLTACGHLLLARSLVALGLLDKVLPQLRAAQDACEENDTRWIAQMEIVCAQIHSKDVSSWKQLDDLVGELLSQQLRPVGADSKRIHQTKLHLIDTLVMAGQSERARTLLKQMAADLGGTVPRLGAELRLAVLQPAGQPREAETRRVIAKCVEQLGNDHLLTLVARLKSRALTIDQREALIDKAITYLGPTHSLVCSAIESQAEALAGGEETNEAIAFLSAHLSSNQQEIEATEPSPSVIRLRFKLSTLLAENGQDLAAQAVFSKAINDCDVLCDQGRFSEANQLLEAQSHRWTKAMQQRHLLSRVALFREWGRPPSDPPPRPFEALLPLAGRF